MTDVRVDVPVLERFVADLFQAVGVQPDHAVLTATRLVEADVRGRSGHGIIRVEPYIDRLEAGG